MKVSKILAKVVTVKKGTIDERYLGDFYVEGDCPLGKAMEHVAKECELKTKNGLAVIVDTVEVDAGLKTMYQEAKAKMVAEVINNG